MPITGGRKHKRAASKRGGKMYNMGGPDLSAPTLGGKRRSRRSRKSSRKSRGGRGRRH